LGDNQAYVFTANSGYEIDQVFIDGIPNATAKEDGFYIFRDVSRNHTIIVTFRASATGIEDVRSQGISIFPNPAKDKIFIQSELQIRKVEVYSLTGALLMSDNNFNGEISVSALPKGIYLLRVYTDNGVTVSKIVKE